MSDTVIYPVDRLDLAFTPQPWAFAVARRAEIDAYFAEQQRAKPALWNGRVLLMHRHVLSGGVLRGDYLETDFASFAAWRAWGRPDAGVHDCFAAAAVRAADGAFIVGVMGTHTFNAGQIYFPCGTPDRSDIAGRTVDLDASARRELAEETGLAAAGFAAEPGWTMVVDGVLMALIKVFQASEGGEALRASVLDRLAREARPEFSDIRIVRGPGDFDPAMPRFVTAFLAERWRAG